MAKHDEDLWLALGEEIEPATELKPAVLRGSQEFAMWMHNPITAAFFAYLGDDEVYLKDLIVELVIYGQVRKDAQGINESADVQRGRLLALRDLQRITLADIAEFYRQKRGAIVS